MKNKTKYNLQFIWAGISIFLGFFIILCAVAGKLWAQILCICGALFWFGFMINLWRKEYINDKELENIIQDEIDLIMSKVVPCKDCKLNPIVWFRGFGCHIECPKCRKITGGETDPLEDVKVWNKMNKIRGKK